MLTENDSIIVQLVNKVITDAQKKNCSTSTSSLIPERKGLKSG